MAALHLVLVLLGIIFLVIEGSRKAPFAGWWALAAACFAAALWVVPG